MWAYLRLELARGCGGEGLPGDGLLDSIRVENVRYSLYLLALLAINWLLWSGHFDSPLLLSIGLASCLFCLFVSRRMRIVDEEGAPVQLGLRPITRYAPWLAWEVVKSNLEVVRIVLSRRMPLQRNLVEVPITPRTEIGRVILANSVTLTPGTVSVQLEGDRVLVHALSLDDAEEDLEGEMGRRVRELEGEE